jgi:electron transfer flavoprotein beta subunit
LFLKIAEFVQFYDYYFSNFVYSFVIFAVSFFNKNKALIMKILVCITQAPDTTTKISFTDNDTKLNENGVTWIINPYDEWYSLVRAIELKEAGIATDVHIISVGEANCEPIMRKAFALGGDAGFRIDTATHDTFIVASEIANFAKTNNYDLILCGKESIDYNNGSTGAMIAEMLDMPFITNATKLDITNATATVTREIEGGEEIATCALPLVISTQKGMAEARIPNMKGIMGSRTKPLTVVPASGITAATSITKYELPESKGGIKMFGIDDMDALVKALHEEAKVI